MSDISEQPSASPKKPYKKPELNYWGTLQEMTRTGGKSSSIPDGGSAKQNKQTS